MDRAKTVALPETRQLDVLAQLLERRGANVLRCPLVSIKDSPDTDRIVDWLRRFGESPPDLLLIYTGEGVRRLTGFAERAGLRAIFIAALGTVPLLTRGPKPVRALRDLGLKPTHEAVAPTTAGVIETLRNLPIDGCRIGVQLYGDDPNELLMHYLASRAVETDCVAPYVYAGESDDAAVLDLIDAIEAQRLDAIAFTSKAQVERLFKVAAEHDRGQALAAALAELVVAAVGPVVAAELAGHEIGVDVVPESNFFMKPLVNRLLERLAVG